MGSEEEAEEAEDDFDEMEDLCDSMNQTSMCKYHNMTFYIPSLSTNTTIWITRGAQLILMFLDL